MAYVESFKRAMERARQSVSYWDRKTLDHLQAAHDAEMRQCSKSEYHRGYTDGQAVRDADQWQLDRERQNVMCELQKLRDRGSVWGRELVVALGLSVEATNDDFCDRLIHLLGGKSINKGAETSAKVVKNGEKYQLATYDELGNERHKVVCELRDISIDELCKKYDYIDIYPEFIWSIGRAIGLRHGAGFEEIINRLIHLLGDECNFSGVESDTDTQDDGANPAETPEEQSDNASLDTPSSITDELRKWASGDVWSRKWDEFSAIADRIDAQFERDELQAKLAEYESCDLAQTHRTLKCMLGEVKNLYDTLKARADAKPRITKERDKYRKLAKRNEQWCDSLLDLIRDAASEYQESQMWEQVFRDHLTCMREQRDDLQSQLQAIRDVIDGTQQADG